MLTAEQTVTQTCAVELSRAALVALLDRAKRVVPTRFPKPILMCVHLEASESLLRLQATDGELSLFAQMPVDGSLPACVVPLSELSCRLKASKHPTCSLSLSDDGERLLINGGRVEHALQTYDSAEFPLVPSQLEGDSIEVDAAELVHAVKVASHAVAKEPSRYAINGILLESNEKGSRIGDQLSALSFQPMVACAPDAPIRGPHLSGASRGAPYTASIVVVFSSPTAIA